jgi:outer membrane protein assembly factor BamB
VPISVVRRSRRGIRYQLVAIDPTTSATWSVDLGSPPRGCVVDGSGAVIAIAGTDLVAVDLATRSVRWRVPAYKGNDIVLGANGTVYLTTDDSDLVALGF